MFVICHMLASLDGKIDGDFFSMPENAPAIEAYGKLRGFYKCQATLYGTTTMLGGYADGRLTTLPSPENTFPMEDYINPEGISMGNYIVSIDPAGILAWSSHRIQKKGRPEAHVIEVLTKQVSPDYLSYLRGFGISYLFAGTKELDCALLLNKLWEHFGIRRLMIAGGGTINASFLQAGLIQELSLVIAPVADGSTTAVSIFENADFLPTKNPVPLALKHVTTLEGGTLWLRYTLPSRV